MPGLTRPNFFQGQVLTDEDLAAAQEYHREQHYRHNRLMLGSGVVRGLGVSVGSGAGTSAVVSVRPGVAIDPIGRELEFEGADSLALPRRTPICPILVVVRFTEHPARPMPGLVDADTDADWVVHTRTQEGCECVLVPEAEMSDADLASVVVVGRLVNDRRGQWRVDLKYRVRRVRSRG
jgi:hypothetical protein